jgi:MFS family permease
LSPSTHYRWYVVALTLVNQAVSVGILVYSFALFVVPWLDTFGISRSQVMVAIFLMQLTGGMISPLVGRFLDQYSVRNMVVFGAISMGCGLLLSSAVNAHWQIILIHTTLLPLGMSLCGTLSSQTLVGKWFTTQRGMAIGISAAGTSIGGFVFPLLTAELISEYEWRTTLQILGAIAIVVLVPLNLLVLRTPVPERVAAEGGLGNPQNRLWTSREILRTRVFWIPIAGLLPVNASFAAVQFNLGAYVADLGYEQLLAAQLISIGSISMIIGKFIFGGLADRVDHRYLFWTMAVAMALALLLYQGGPSSTELTVAAVLQGIATGGVMPMTGNAYAARFGTLSFGRVLGLVTMFTMLGSFGSLLSGWVFDLTHTYDYVFWLLIAMQVPCVILMYWLPPAASQSAQGPAQTASMTSQTPSQVGVKTDL